MSVTCRRNGCGQLFDPTQADEAACRYHPGAPVFHEGMKGWSCCKKRFTDFGEFLAHPGCTTGPHSLDAPQQAAANDAVRELSSAQVDRLSLEEQKARGNIRDAAPKVALALDVTASLERALAAQAAEARAEAAAQTVQVGQACTRNACKATYQSPASDEEDCVHHTGAPVFHEGYKYWSCCPKRKTYEFDEFLDFRGCSIGRHRWFKPAEEQAKNKSCRLDWFQSDTHVVVTLFAKCIDPQRSSVKLNTDSMTVQLVYQRSFSYTLELHLAGKITVESSSAQLMSTKMDVKLAKAAPGDSWAALTAEDAAKAAKQAQGEEK